MESVAEPKLSIVVPVYNGEKVIENTVCSVLSSSYRNLELLLIDDGSTDKSHELCLKYAAADNRIKVYHKENEGIAATRNYGIDHASGDYIGFCDQDDEISSDMYGKMMARIASDGSQAAICGCCRRKADGGEVVFESYTDEIIQTKLIKKKLLFPMLFKGFGEFGNREIRIYTAIWKCIISRRLIVENNLRFYGFVSYEDDFIMLLQLFLRAAKISTLSDILYYWNTNINSEMHRCIRRYIKDLEIRQQKLINFVTNELEQNGIDKKIISKYVYVQECRNVLLVLDNYSALRGEKFFSKIKAIKNNPSVIYIQSVKNVVKAEKGFVRNTVIIPLIRKKHIISAYFLNRLIDQIRFIVERHYVAERIERMIKRG